MTFSAGFSDKGDASMTRIFGLTMTALLVVAGSASLRADEGNSPQAVIDKALNSMGGEALVSKYKASTWKSKGTFHGMGDQAMVYTADSALELPDKMKMHVEGEFNDQKFSMTNVINGDKSWMKMTDQAMEANDDQRSAAKEGMYVRWVTSLVPLKDKSFTLTSLPQIQIDGKPAVGVKVASKGHPDVSLYFDKDSGLLVRSIARLKNEQGQDMDQETDYANYKDIQGVKQPTKLSVKRDGKLYVQQDNTDIKLMEKLDDKTFSEP
jgi:hypothetical protein